MMDDRRHASSRSPSGSPASDDARHVTMETLARDNETLRAMLRRAQGPNAKADEAALLHLQTTLDRTQEALRHERERRAIAESLVAELRHDREMSLKSKDAELRKHQDAITQIKKSLNDHQKIRRDDQRVISILKRENQRLLDLTMQPAGSASPSAKSSGAGGTAKSKIASPDYTQVVHSARLRLDVPSCTIKHIGQVPPAVMRRSIGEKSRSRSPAASSRAPPRQTFEVNQRCTCHHMQGIVRFIGNVPGLGLRMAGVELLVRGGGDNEGMFNGITYFKTPYRSAIFCPLSELQPPMDSRAVTPSRAVVRSLQLTPHRRSADDGAATGDQRVQTIDESDESSNRNSCSLVRTDAEDIRFSVSTPTDDSLKARPNSLVRTDDEAVRPYPPSSPRENEGARHKEGGPCHDDFAVTGHDERLEEKHYDACELTVDPAERVAADGSGEGAADVPSEAAIEILPGEATDDLLLDEAADDAVADEAVAVPLADEATVDVVGDQVVDDAVAGEVRDDTVEGKSAADVVDKGAMEVAQAETPPQASPINEVDTSDVVCC